MIRGMEVEIDATERAIGFGLAEDNGDLAIECDAMAQMWSAIFVGFDGLFHERTKGAFAVVGSLVHANDVFVESLEGLGHLLLEHINGHVPKVKSFG